ncbi:MAG: hypothetical protein WBL67_19670 [Nitrososphaeraceae archaeon]
MKAWVWGKILISTTFIVKSERTKMKHMKALTLAMTLALVSIFFTFNIGNSLAQENTTLTANQSSGTNSSGTYNSTAAGLPDNSGDESGQISGRSRS